MFWIKIPIVLLVAYLWYVGGSRHAYARDLFVPILIGIGIFLSTHQIIVAILSIATANTIRLGYGAYDTVNDDKPSLLAKITKDRNGWYIRALWAFIVGISTVLPRLCVNFDWKQVLWVVLFSAICFTVVRLRSNVLITDIFIGSAFALTIFV